MPSKEWSNEQWKPISQEGSGEDTYRDWFLGRNKVTRSMEQRIGPTTLLMYNTSKFAAIIVPRRARSSGESLDTSECRVLRVITVALVTWPKSRG